MDSKILGEYGFEWHDWKNKLPIPYGQKGVYAIRLKNTLERKVDKSDILYIGSSGNLPIRFFCEYLYGSGGTTTQRIHKKLFEEGYLEKTEIGWITTENFDKLEKYVEGIKWPSAIKHEELEKRLKLKFEKEHGEYPLWNLIL